jgi:TonB family protein
MYFDFEDYRPDTPTIASPISRREGLLLSIIVHLGFVILILVAPDLPFVRAMREDAVQAAEQLRLEQLRRQREQARFVFVEPRLDVEAPKPPPRPDLSDKDRTARAPERAPDPANPLPFARGNSPELVEGTPTPPAPRRGPPTPPPSNGSPSRDGTPLELPGPPAAPPVGADRGAAGSTALAEALRNLQRYMPQQHEESFNNPQGGGGEFGSIQFDTKGVEFGPWIRRFVAQVKRNWFIPYSAMALRGQVVLTFNIHRDGTITDLAIAAPSSVESFNHSSFNAIRASNPTQPLPAEYPDDKAFFTVTFCYNVEACGR